MENFRDLSFFGKSLGKKDDENFSLKGDLIIKGITKEVVLDVEFEE